MRTGSSAVLAPLLVLLAETSSPGELPFDRSDFDDVRETVARRYVDARIDEPWAWSRAAVFVLASNKSRPLLVVPESYYKARRDEPADKEWLQGRMSKIADSDDFVILEAPDPRNAAPKPPLTADQVRQEREGRRARQVALRDAWRKAVFGPGHFDRIMAFARRENPDSKTLWLEAARGFLSSLDPHCRIVSKADWEAGSGKPVPPDAQGIGAILTSDADDGIRVEAVLRGGPAAKAGLRAGDRLIAIDGKSAENEPLALLISRIRGPNESAVELTVAREGEVAPRNFSAVRAAVTTKDVQGELLADLKDAGYIRISTFSRNSVANLAAELRRLDKQTASGLRGLVLDLRDNAGGLLTHAIKAADLFLKKGRILSVERRGENSEDYDAGLEPDFDIPLVVLVNAGTSFAAEFVAAALQDRGRALIVGEQTFGKALIQTLYDPPKRKDYYIKLTMARYRTPSGRLLDRAGVRPDLPASAEDDPAKAPAFREEDLSLHSIPAHEVLYESTNKALAARASAHVAKKARGGSDLVLAVEALNFMLSER